MMYPLVESLAVEDGAIQHLEYHMARFERSYAACYGHAPAYVLWEEGDIDLPNEGYYKLRILYNELGRRMEIAPYKIATVKSLKCIENNSISYSVKETNRDLLQQLYATRAQCDDILIIKNGMVSDTFAGNVLFYNGQDWVTPDTPLLQGTQRAYLLASGKIIAKPVAYDDIGTFLRFMVINAMCPFDLSRSVHISAIE